MVGMHRVVRALLEGRTSIRAVQFAVHPEPDYRKLPVRRPSLRQRRIWITNGNGLAGEHQSGDQGDQVRPALSRNGMTAMPSSRHMSRRCGSAEARREPADRAVSAAMQSARLTARFLR
jgi:hypothetical protein